jgi:hypothetical protein
VYVCVCKQCIFVQIVLLHIFVQFFVNRLQHKHSSTHTHTRTKVSEIFPKAEKSENKQTISKTESYSLSLSPSQKINREKMFDKNENEREQTKNSVFFLLAKT